MNETSAAPTPAPREPAALYLDSKHQASINRESSRKPESLSTKELRFRFDHGMHAYEHTAQYNAIIDTYRHTYIHTHRHTYIHTCIHAYTYSTYVYIL